MKNRTLKQSFKCAFDGIYSAIREERNFNIHIIAACISTLAGIYFKISKNEWLTLVLIITVVIVTELLNTCIENLVDMITISYNKQAKIIKDMAAGAVLISSIAAVIVAIIIFLPKIIEMF